MKTPDFLTRVFRWFTYRDNLLREYRHNEQCLRAMTFEHSKLVVQVRGLKDERVELLNAIWDDDLRARYQASVLGLGREAVGE